MIRDLYAGAGGWGVALTLLDLDHIAYEINADACATSAAAGHTTIQADLTTKTPHHETTGLVGSPPCQPYSKAGKKQGRDDPRSRHALVLPAWAEAGAPTWVAAEQVPGAKSVFTRLAVELSNLGYKVATYVLHAEQYGVPQTRERMILMAHARTRPPKPTPTHSRYYPHQPHRLDPGVDKWVSMADALGWGTPNRPYPTIAAGTASGGADADMVGGTGARAALNAERQKPTWVYNRPSTTIVGSFHPEIVAAPNFRTGVSRQNQPGSVRVTVQEAGVLQGFPADYPWQGSRTSRFQQVGNAIPPPLAKAVIQTLTSL